MKFSMLGIAVSLSICLMFVPRADAIDPPHDSSNGYTCANCHAVHITLGSTGYTNACVNCHRPGVPLAEKKPFTLADIANPFGTFTGHVGGKLYQTSHNWTGPHVNRAAGADEPQPGSDLLSTKTIVGMACPRCHDMHTYKDMPFLRAKNDQDQMCLDCHRSRNTTNQTLGTHPVNFTYTGARSLVRVKPSQFYNPPLNSNPNNPTSQMKFKGGAVLCTTCHGVHYVDSNSATFDNSTSYNHLKQSSGFLLRTDMFGPNGSSPNICSNCHVKPNHNYRGQNIQCADCHGGHVDAADGTVPNVYLIRRYMNVSSSSGWKLNKKVMFQYTSAGTRNYKDAAGTGVCQACHVVPEGDTYPAAHKLVTAPSSACSICHPHNSSKGAFSAASGSCAACHGHDQTSSNPIATGKHSAHINTSLNPALGTARGCVDCHALTVLDNTTISPASHHANGMKDYSGVRAGGRANYDLTTHVCSNFYCHSDGKDVRKDMTATEWDSSATLDCRGCHGSDPSPAFSSQAGEPNYASTGAGTSHANSHYKHTKAGAVSCDSCHTLTTATGTAIRTGSLNHVNGTIDVTFNTAKAGDSVNYNPSTKTCSNIACHFGGTAQWGGNLGCTSCHGGDAASGTPMSSGKHQAHINNAAFLGSNFVCADCHAKTVSGDTTIVDATKHANGMVDYSGARARGSYTYNASTHVCSATYCHTDGKGAGKDMSGSAWTSAATLDCKGCHGSDTNPAFASQAGEPNYVSTGPGTARANSHFKHTKAGAVSCDSCHTQTTTSGTAIASGSILHVNGSIDVTFNAAKAGASVTYNPGTKTCSNISCHFGGSAQWGATLGCTSCHGGDAASGSPMSTGKHQAHINNAGFIGTNFACSECHAKTVSGDSTIVDATKHGNGMVDYSGARAGNSTTYSSALHVCSATYCHSDGKGTRKNMSGSAWTSATTLNCFGCHGSDPAPAFTSLAGEPNYANTGAGTARANSHDKHTKSGAVSCDSCHTETTTTGTAINIGSARHVNGSIDVTFNTTKAGASATYTPATKTCSNISCHGNNSATWGGSLYCQNCHGGIADLDDFNGTFWDNGTISTIKMSGGWDQTGHGRPVSAGAYDSGNAPADFTGIPNPCDFCHDSGTAHKTLSNIFRFRYYSTAEWGRNAVCQVCHATGAPGVTISGLPRNASKKIDSRHFGSKHGGGSNNGGQFCWDCHDPHGDGNAYMIHDQVAKKSDQTTGAPLEQVATTFIPGSQIVAWGDFVKTPANNGICQVCHDASKTNHFTSTTYDANHNAGGVCVACHRHSGSTPDAGFAPNGNCNTCHGYPPVRRGLAAGTFGFSGNYSSARYEDYSGGGGAHTADVHVKPTARASEGWANCAICHSNGSMSPSTHTMQMPVRPSNVTINVDDRHKADYRRGLDSDRYSGRLTDSNDNQTGSCSNVSCHFKHAKKWSTER